MLTPNPMLHRPAVNDLKPDILHTLGPPVSSAFGEGGQMASAIPSLFAGWVVPLAATLVAFPIGMAAALGWPLSDTNMGWALAAGGVWGCIGAVVVGLATVATAPTRRYAVTGVGATVWAGVSGMCFYVYVAGVASC